MCLRVHSEGLFLGLASSVAWSILLFCPIRGRVGGIFGVRWFYPESLPEAVIVEENPYPEPD